MKSISLAFFFVATAFGQRLPALLDYSMPVTYVLHLGAPPFKSHDFLFQQVRIPGPGGAAPAGVGGYTGPGDIVTTNLYLWYGLRAFSSATRGNKAVNVCDASDVHCVDALTDATTGALIIPSSNPNCGSSGCTIKIWYDHTGALRCGAAGGTACDATQATIGNRATLITNCIGSLPCASFTGSSTQSYSVAVSNFSTPISQPCTFSTVIERTAAFTTTGAWWGDSNTSSIAFLNSANTIQIFYGSAPTISVSDSAFHAMQLVINGASSDGYIDGSGNSISPGAASCVTANNVDLFGKDGFGNLLTGKVTEFGMWSATFSAGSKSTMNSNQHAYWGF